MGFGNNSGKGKPKESQQLSLRIPTKSMGSDNKELDEGSNDLTPLDLEQVQDILHEMSTIPSGEGLYSGPLSPINEQDLRLITFSPSPKRLKKFFPQGSYPLSESNGQLAEEGEEEEEYGHYDEDKHTTGLTQSPALTSKYNSTQSQSALMNGTQLTSSALPAKVIPLSERNAWTIHFGAIQLKAKIKAAGIKAGLNPNYDYVKLSAEEKQDSKIINRDNIPSGLIKEITPDWFTLRRPLYNLLFASITAFGLIGWLTELGYEWFIGNKVLDGLDKFDSAVNIENAYGVWLCFVIIITVLDGCANMLSADLTREGAKKSLAALFYGDPTLLTRGFLADASRKELQVICLDFIIKVENVENKQRVEINQRIAKMNKEQLIETIITLQDRACKDTILETVLIRPIRRFIYDLGAVTPDRDPSTSVALSTLYKFILISLPRWLLYSTIFHFTIGATPNLWGLEALLPRYPKVIGGILGMGGPLGYYFAIFMANGQATVEKWQEAIAKSSWSELENAAIHTIKESLLWMWEAPQYNRLIKSNEKEKKPNQDAVKLKEIKRKRVELENRFLTGACCFWVAVAAIIRIVTFDYLLLTLNESHPELFGDWLPAAHVLSGVSAASMIFLMVAPSIFSKVFPKDEAFYQHRDFMEETLLHDQNSEVAKVFNNDLRWRARLIGLGAALVFPAITILALKINYLQQGHDFDFDWSSKNLWANTCLWTALSLIAGVLTFRNHYYFERRRSEVVMFNHLNEFKQAYGNYKAEVNQEKRAKAIQALTQLLAEWGIKPHIRGARNETINKVLEQAGLDEGKQQEFLQYYDPTLSQPTYYGRLIAWAKRNFIRAAAAGTTAVRWLILPIMFQGAFNLYWPDICLSPDDNNNAFNSKKLSYFDFFVFVLPATFGQILPNYFFFQKNIEKNVGGFVEAVHSIYKGLSATESHLTRAPRFAAMVLFIIVAVLLGVEHKKGIPSSLIFTSAALIALTLISFEGIHKRLLLAVEVAVASLIVAAMTSFPDTFDSDTKIYLILGIAISFVITTTVYCMKENACWPRNSVNINQLRQALPSFSCPALPACSISGIFSSCRRDKSNDSRAEPLLGASHEGVELEVLS